MDNKKVKREKASHYEDDKHHVISSSVRSARPGNYLFKIESFSLLLQVLLKTKTDKYDSGHFEAGGYQWKLSLYPNGDNKRGGNGYISLYLVMAEPSSLPQGWEVNAMFKFFVFDHIGDNYLTLQDGKERRFHALKTEWGFAKLLPLDVFNDASNGYLIDDSCTFGVEMLLHTNEWKTGSLRIMNKPSNNSYTWKVEKFSTLTQDTYYSDVFTVGGHKWRLMLYPRGDSRVKDKSLSLFLCIYDHSSLPSGWNIYVEYKLSIKDQLNGKHDESICNDWFNATTTAWGYSEFMLLTNLHSASRGFIVNDSVTVEGKITLISVVNS